MDEFKIGQGTHSFQLQILVSDPFIRREGLVYHLSLQGAKRPYNYFKIIIPAEGIQCISLYQFESIIMIFYWPGIYLVRKRRLWTAGNVEGRGILLYLEFYCYSSII